MYMYSVHVHTLVLSHYMHVHAYTVCLWTYYSVYMVLSHCVHVHVHTLYGPVYMYIYTPFHYGLNTIIYVLAHLEHDFPCTCTCTCVLQILMQYMYI